MRTFAFPILALVMLPGIGSAASFTPLGITPGGFYDTRSPLDISADGTTVVGAMYINNQQQAVRWTNGSSPQSMGFMLAGNSSRATAVSANGSVIVGTGNRAPGGETRGFRWTEATGMQGIGDIPEGGNYQYALGVSADGAVVTGYSSTTINGEAFRWTESDGPQPIGTLPYGGSRYSEGLAISADGSVIVGQSTGTVGTSSGRQAIRWTASSGMIPLTPLPEAAATVALAISADGSVIVGNSYVPGCFECGTLARNNAVSWTNEGPATLLGQVPGGDRGSSALAASADGSVIVGVSFEVEDPFRGGRAFIWTANNGMQKLFDVLVMQGATDVTGWTLLQADAVSADGRTITGQGLNPDGMAQPFVVTLNPVPIPAAVWLFGSALAAMGWLRRKNAA